MGRISFLGRGLNAVAAVAAVAASLLGLAAVRRRVASPSARGPLLQIEAATAAAPALVV